MRRIRRSLGKASWPFSCQEQLRCFVFSLPFIDGATDPLCVLMRSDLRQVAAERRRLHPGTNDLIIYSRTNHADQKREKRRLETRRGEERKKEGRKEGRGKAEAASLRVQDSLSRSRWFVITIKRSLPLKALSAHTWVFLGLVPFVGCEFLGATSSPKAAAAADKWQEEPKRC